MKTNYLLSGFLVFLFCFLFISGSQAQGDGEQHALSLDVDGLTRNYLLYEPEGHNSSSEWPLVFLFHGFGGSAPGTFAYTRIYEVADTAKFLVVCPSGLVVQDLIFGGAAPGWHIPGNYAASHDDIAFVDAIIDDLVEHPDFSVNINRIHAAGHSNGGEMAYYLACGLSDKIASVGGVSSQMALLMMDSICTPDRQVSVLHILGTNDPFFPEAGDDVFPPLEGAAEYWADIDNCNEVPTETELPDIDPNDNSTVTLLDYESCDEDFEVLCYRVEGGIHCWPGTSGCNNDILASAEIWRFFIRNPHPDIYSCLPDGFLFSNQNEIDNFAEQYPYCRQIDGDVEISGSTIENLYGLGSIHSIMGGLEIYSSENLQDMSGLEKLEYIGKDLEVFNNMSLESYSGLESLKYIGDDFVISVNNDLEDISSLDSLNYVGQDIMIVGNNKLSGLTGLDNVDTSSFQDLTIKENPELSFCAVSSICEFISDPANQQAIDIKNNATGCNNEEEVELDCITSTDELFFSNKLSIQPNPFSYTTVIIYQLKYSGTATLTVYSHLGELVEVVVDKKHYPGMHQITWQPHDLPAGIYFCSLITETGSSTKKILKIK